MKNIKNYKLYKRERRHAKIRSRVKGTPEKPRLSVFRSNRYIYVQAINDIAGVTIASSCDLKINKGSKMERAEIVGKDIAEKLLKQGIDKVVFDRGGFKYAGRIKKLAESARSAGLKF